MIELLFEPVIINGELPEKIKNKNIPDPECKTGGFTSLNYFQNYLVLTFIILMIIILIVVFTNSIRKNIFSELC